MKKFLFLIALFLDETACDSDSHTDIIAYQNAFSRMATFDDGAVWDEVTYLVSDPSQYTIAHYEIRNDTLSNGIITGRVYKNSESLGTVSKTGNGKVYFTPDNSQEKTLLYDFAQVESQIDGIGSRDLFETAVFKNYADIPRIESNKNYDTGNCLSSGSKWIWAYDSFGGITISGIGSSAGIFAPVAQSQNSAYKTELLQVYNKYKYSGNRTIPYDRLWVFSDAYGRIIYFGNVYYDNQNSIVAPYLPSDFWVQPAEDTSAEFVFNRC